tara:strand:- start:17433 stop:17609 length:177 start_codon:yes stop_codon:yes gene_type:complete
MDITYYKVLAGWYYKMKQIDFAMGYTLLTIELNPKDVEALAHLTKSIKECSNMNGQTN